MDALIAFEEAAASEAFASAGASKRAVPGAAKEPKTAKRAKAKAQPEPEPAFEEEDWDDDDDDEKEPEEEPSDLDKTVHPMEAGPAGGKDEV